MAQIRIPLGNAAVTKIRTVCCASTFPKGCDLGAFTDAQIQQIEDQLNQRPRKRHCHLHGGYAIAHPSTCSISPSNAMHFVVESAVAQSASLDPYSRVGHFLHRSAWCSYVAHRPDQPGPADPSRLRRVGTFAALMRSVQRPTLGNGFICNY